MSTDGVHCSTSEEPDVPGPGTTTSPARGATVAERPLLNIDDLGWTREEAADTRARLRPFENDWDAPGMDAYDALYSGLQSG